VLIDGSDNLNAAELEIIDRVLHELVSNAHRHGDADRIDCSISIANDAVLIVAQDNGAGPQGGGAGLGSHILSAVTENSWTRESATPNGTLVRCRVPRLRSGSTTTNAALRSPT
jgi:two-component sensor histidine kinase